MTRFSRYAATAVLPFLLLAGAAPSPAGGAGITLRGKHVLIGIVDTGIDYRNADFRNPGGSTRIKYLWDQSQNGNPPAGYSYGYQCDSHAMDAGTCPERDTDGHGTHVAGVAAGNARSGGAQAAPGMAPQADLIIVKSDFDDGRVIDAWKYMVAKAKQLGEPIVINNSFGGENGPHDGTGAEARAIDALSGPGVIFVVAAGNDGHQGLHTQGTVAQGKTATVAINARGTLPEMTFSVFYPPGDDLTATLSGPHSMVLGPVNAGTYLVAHPAGNRKMEVRVDTQPPDAAHHAVVVDVSTAGSGNGMLGTWRLTLTGKRVMGSATYNAWLLTGGDGAQTFAHAVETDTLTEPADAAAAVTVGDYATRTRWTDLKGRTHGACDYTPCANGILHKGEIAFHSSVGPTADGRHKPDIAAPGVLVAATKSEDVPICKEKSSDAANCVDPVFVTRDRKHLIDTGTSAAAPYVAGLIARMLQANRSLDPKAIKAILRATARHDRFTGTAAWTPTFGAGKVNPGRAIQRLLSAR